MIHQNVQWRRYKYAVTHRGHHGAGSDKLKALTGPMGSTLKLSCVVQKPRLQMTVLWPVSMVTSSLWSASSTLHCTTELSCVENPCCSHIGKNWSLGHAKTMSYKLASFQKYAEGAMMGWGVVVLGGTSLNLWPIRQHGLMEIIMTSKIYNLEWLSGPYGRCSQSQHSTRRGLVLYTCIIELGHHWFRQ